VRGLAGRKPASHSTGPPSVLPRTDTPDQRLWRELGARVVARCRREPLFFSRYVLGGEQPWSRQAEILHALRDHPRVAVRSGHGVGKSWTAARAAIWFLYTHPHSIVLTTAPTHRQVRSILWAEIRRQVRTARLPLGGRLTETRLVLDDDWFALGLSTDEPERFQGYHAEHLLLIMDEAPGVPEMIYDAARGLLTSRHARVLLIGNPTTSSGPFYEAFRNPEWRHIRVPCTDCPNVRSGELLYPKLVTRGWVETQRREWGEDSPSFRARVMGEFPAESESRLIPLAWLQAAQERAERLPAQTRRLRLGVDVARYGTDRTVLLVADDLGVREVREATGLSTMEVAGRVLALARARGIPAERVAVDDTGVGGGVVDRLREQGFAVRAFRGAARAASRHFANLRAEAYWHVRQRLAPDAREPLAIPSRERSLCHELAAIEYGFNSRGQIEIEAKDAIRARLGRSPDAADALAICLATAAMGRQPRAWEA